MSEFVQDVLIGYTLGMTFASIYLNYKKDNK